MWIRCREKGIIFSLNKVKQNSQIFVFINRPTCMHWHVILEPVHSSYCKTDPYKIYYEIYKQIYIGRKLKENVRTRMYKRISWVMFATEVGIVPVRLLLFSLLLNNF